MDGTDRTDRYSGRRAQNYKKIKLEYYMDLKVRK